MEEFFCKEIKPYEKSAMPSVCGFIQLSLSAFVVPDYSYY